MVLKKDGFVCSIAYGLKKAEPPHSISLCEIANRFVVGLFLWSIIWVVGGGLLVCMAALFLVGSIAVGYYPVFTRVKGSKEDLDFRKIPFVPTGLPGIVAAGGWLAYCVRYALTRGLDYYTTSYLEMAVMFTFLCIGSAFLGFTAWGCERLWRRLFKREAGSPREQSAVSQAWSLFVARLKAQKQKVCPMVRIE